MIMVVCTIILEVYHHFHRRPQLSEAQTPELSICSSVFQPRAEQKNQGGCLGGRSPRRKDVAALPRRCARRERAEGQEGHGASGETQFCRVCTHLSPSPAARHRPRQPSRCSGRDSWRGEGDALHARLRSSANALACPSDSVTRLQHPDPSCLALINSV